MPIDDAMDWGSDPANRHARDAILRAYEQMMHQKVLSKEDLFPDESPSEEEVAEAIESIRKAV